MSKPEPRNSVSNRNSTKTQFLLQSSVTVLTKLISFALVIFVACYVSWYLEMLHENLLWFTNIRDVEREISFRTEQGLYYSYYKQLVNNPNVFKAIEDLKSDNVTEHGRTINVLGRFNIHSEVALAVLFRFLGIQEHTEPILFYVKVVFSLQGLFAAAIYVNAWTLGRSWIAGLLAVCYFVSHKNDSTRVNYSVPLRESFSIPFIFCQMAFVSFYLQRRTSNWKHGLYLVAILFSTFCYAITWQFSQFVSLLQVANLYVLATADQISKKKALHLFLVHFVCFLTICLLQYGNTMILASIVMSFIPIASASIVIQGRGCSQGVWRNIRRCILHGFLTLTGCFLLNCAVKFVFSDGSDQHIYKFIKGKLGFEDLSDFESRLYLCNEAFKFMDFNSYTRLSGGLLLPIFCSVVFVWMSRVVFTALMTFEFCGEEPDKRERVDGDHSLLAFHTVQSILFALLAMTTMRMKCLWVPHVCIVASAGVTHPLIWRRMSLPSFLSGRAAALVLIAYLVRKLIPFINEQMNDLNEFWDPDTVELMEWIQSNTPQWAAFAGSMQLLAGVKLCTGRPVTNHPHFEDSWLRKRTFQIYQMYSKQPPELVYEMLRDAGASYIILEDGICLSPAKDFCHLVDILDINNGHVPELGVPNVDGLVDVSTPRFCDEIRHGSPQYSRFFKSVFANRTFRIYQVLTKERWKF